MSGTETAKLIIKVDSNEVGTAGKRLGWLTDGAGRAERATDGLVSAFKRLVTVAAALAVMKKVTDTLADFEEGMSQVRAISGATEEEFARLSETARKLGADTRYSARQAADGMQFLAQAGFNTNQIIAAMPGMLDLATAGALDLASAADIASNIMSGFNLRAEESARVADILAVAAAQSNTNVFQLGDAMKYVAPISASMGISVEETAAAIGILSNAGLQGSMAGTGLRQVLSSLAGPTKEAADILAAYGVKLDEVNPSTNSLSVVIERLAKAGITAGDALQIFGDRGAPAFLSLVSQKDGLDKLNVAVNQAEGSAKKMAAVMGNNLRGDFKELSSATEELMLKLGDAGLLQALRDGTQATTEFVRALNDMVASGEAAAWFDLILSKIELLDDGFENLATNIIGAWTMAMDWLTGDGEATVKGLIDIFILLPENVRAVAQATGASMGLMVEYAVAVGKGIYEGITAWFDYLISMAENVGAEIMSHLDPKATDFDYTQAQAAAFDKFAASIGGSWDTVTSRVEGATQAWEEQIVAIMDEWDANTAASDDKLRRIDELRAAYAKLKEERAKADTPATAPIGPKAAPEGGGRFQTREFDQLRQQLQLEEKTVQESYARRLELIQRNTQEGSDLRIELEAALNERLAVEMDNAHEARFSRLTDAYNAEQNALQLALENKEISEKEFQERSVLRWNQYTESVKGISVTGSQTLAKVQQGMMADVLGRAADISAQMSSMAQDGSAAQKALFVTSKALSMAQAYIMTELAAIAAMAPPPYGLGPVAGLPYSQAIRALGYASIGLMGAQTVMEVTKHEHGGMISSGSVGLVGEAGVELIRGPAVVTSARSTADLGGGMGGGVNVTVNINNQTDAEATVTESDGPNGKVLDILIKRVKSDLANDIRTGGSSLTRALESTYPLRRGAA